MSLDVQSWCSNKTCFFLKLSKAITYDSSFRKFCQFTSQIKTVIKEYKIETCFSAFLFLFRSDFSSSGGLIISSFRFEVESEIAVLIDGGGKLMGIFGGGIENGENGA